MQQLSFFVGDAPHLSFQLIQPASESQDGTETTPDITGWTAVLTMAPQTAGVRRVNAACTIEDPASATFAYDVPGGLLPGETPPLIAASGSFTKPSTYICRLVVRTINADGRAGEILTTEAFGLSVNPREQ